MKAKWHFQGKLKDELLKSFSSIVKKTSVLALIQTKG